MKVAGGKKKITNFFIKKDDEKERSTNGHSSIDATGKREIDTNKKHHKPRHNVIRPLVIGMQRRHLRVLARTGGLVLFGEIINRDKQCESCRRGDNEDNMLLCDNCNSGYHMVCLRPILHIPPADDWFCPKCSEDKLKAFDDLRTTMKENQTSLLQFFQIKGGRTSDRSEEVKKETGAMFLIAPPSKSAAVRIEQMASIAAASKAKGMIFDNDLYYPPGGSAKPSDNDVTKDSTSKFQSFTKSDLKVFQKFKAMQKQGLYPPVRVTKHDIEGFVVVADEKIKRYSLITEYCGIVEKWAEAKDKYDDDDSLMDLIRNDDENVALVIVPTSRGNLARFISGINNHDKKLRAKQNVTSVRRSVNGQSRVLLYASKDILPGNQLYYDYNALDKNGYPTDKFV